MIVSKLCFWYEICTDKLKYPILYLIMAGRNMLRKGIYSIINFPGPGGLTTSLIPLLTVSGQAIRAEVASPVKSLRSE